MPYHSSCSKIKERGNNGGNIKYVPSPKKERNAAASQYKAIHKHEALCFAELNNSILQRKKNRH